MTQTILTPTVITREALRLLENNLVMAKAVNRDYEDKFQKIGDTITIRKPVNFTTRSNMTLAVQDVIETSTTLVIDQIRGVDFSFDSLELTLKIEEFSDRYLKPALVKIANEVDRSLTGLYSSVYNCVGAVGTAPNTWALSVALLGKKMDELAMPQDGRALILNPQSHWELAGGLVGAYNPSAHISKIFEKGSLGVIGGFDIAMDQNIRVHTSGPIGGSPVAGTIVEAAAVIPTTTWAAGGPTSRLLIGDVFTVATGYAVNPISKVSTAVLQDFVVTANFSDDANEIGDVSISPNIYAAGAYQNVTALPASGQLLAFRHTTGQTSINNLAFTKDAFTLAVRPMVLPKGVDFAAQESRNGLSIRIVRDWVHSSGTFPCRVEILYGVKAVRPECAVRLLR